MTHLTLTRLLILAAFLHEYLAFTFTPDLLHAFGYLEHPAFCFARTVHIQNE